MNRLDVSCPTIHSLYYLYKNLDKLNLNYLANNHVYFSYPIIKTESLSIYYTVSQDKKYLELKKTYLELYKFKIPLGNSSNLVNKRVRNALMVKLHKVLNKTNKEKIIEYIHFIFKKRIKLIFSDMFSWFNKNIKAKLFRNKKECRLSDYFLSFSNQFKLDCLIKIKKSLTGTYEVKVTGSFNPFYNFIETFKMTVRGNKSNIVEKFNLILDKKVFVY